MSIDVTDIPKVVLHEHIEGSVSPKTVLKLAERHKVTFPEQYLFKKGEYDELDFPEGRYAYDESEFIEFIKTYDVVSDLVRTPDDYFDITKDYLLRNAKLGLIYCELIMSPYHICVDASGGNGKETLDDKKYMECLEAIYQAILEVNKDYGTYTYLHACGVRHLGKDNVAMVADFIKAHPHKLIKGVNIAGDERANEFADFAYFHDMADSLGLAKSYHAGEICGPESIVKALAVGSKRIGHGIASIKDALLLEELASKGVTLEVAPTSNRILVREFDGDITRHPVKKIYDAGVRLTLNTDDAGIFGTDIGKEYRIAANKLGFKRAELFDVTLCGVEAGFADDKVKAEIKSLVLSKLKQEDKAEMKKVAEETNNKYLKSRLLERVVDM